MENKTGYHYSPSPYHPPIGHSQLEFYLFPSPENNKDDLKKARFSIIDRGSIKEIIISHPWPGESGKPLLVSPGLFRIWEKDEDIHYGLCLGGKLMVTNAGEFTHCVLHSSAPIFNLQDKINTPGMMLASEVEALLAERQAYWRENEDEYIRKLTMVDPLRLFTALIAKIEEEQKQIPTAARGETYWGEEHFLHTIKKSLEQANHWPAQPDRLEDIL